MLRRSTELIVAVAGVFKAGGCAVMIDPGDPPDRRRAMVDDTGTRIVLSSADHPHDEALAVDFIDVGRIPARADAPRVAEPTLDNAAHVLQTSGSTGRPKPLVVPHRVLAHSAPWQRRIQRIGPADRGAWLAAPTTGVSMLVELWPFLTAGSSVVVPEPYVTASPEELRDWIVAQGVTHSYLVGPMAQALGEQSWPVDTRLRLVQVGSDRLHRWPGGDLPFEVGTCYGATEANMVATSLYPWADRDTSRTAAPGALPTMGREWPHVGIHLLEDGLRPVADGDVGEVYVSGPELARGYLQASMTAAKFVPDPFGAPGGRLYRTGDLARRAASGLYTHVGRTDHQVRIRGNRVEPGEVEATLLRHPSVRQAVVVAVDEADGQRSLVAYVVGSKDVPTAHLHRVAAEQLPPAARPKHIVQLDALPLTANKKIDRTKLPAPVPEVVAPEDGETSGDPRLAAIQRACAEVLRRASFGPDENFFLAGGDSLSAARVLTRLRRSFGARLTMRDMVLHPTARELLGRWDAGTSEQSHAAAEPLRSNP
jgi:amino acid adenylation domain-containing protein